MKRIILLAVVILMSAGCTPLRSVVWGASLEAQVDASAVNDGDGMHWRALGGATTAYWADDIIATMGRGRTAVVIGSTNIVDAIKDGGWNETDEAVLAWIYMSRGSDDCMAVVLPGNGPLAEDLYPGITVEVAEAIAWLSAHLPNAVAWQPIIDANPDYVGMDGIHLATETAIAERYGAITSAADICKDVLA